MKYILTLFLACTFLTSCKEKQVETASVTTTVEEATPTETKKQANFKVTP